MMGDALINFLVLFTVVSIAHTQELPHKSMNLDCDVCHHTQDWTRVSFDHSRTQFELTDQHAEQPCQACHQIEDFSRVLKKCDGCHTDVHQGKLTYVCETCHLTKSWNIFDVFRVHNNSVFPVLGAHARLDCQACHSSEIVGEYSRLSSDCISCHEDNYKNTKNPEHLRTGFGIRCEDCHSMFSWIPATFDHSATAFPLTGAHAQVNCQDCHGSGYANTPTDCFFCHENEYLNTKNPNHQVVQFPRTCENCHTPNDWNQASWDHDSQYFPIYSGKHNGRWDTCEDCHTISNYQNFECIFCHEHNKTKMDDKHRERRDYQYLSTACYHCHPRGRE